MQPEGIETTACVFSVATINRATSVSSIVFLFYPSLIFAFSSVYGYQSYVGYSDHHTSGVLRQLPRGQGSGGVDLGTPRGSDSAERPRVAVPSRGRHGRGEISTKREAGESDLLVVAPGRAAITGGVWRFFFVLGGGGELRLEGICIP